MKFSGKKIKKFLLIFHAYFQSKGCSKNLRKKKNHRKPADAGPKPGCKNGEGDGWRFASITVTLCECQPEILLGCCYVKGTWVYGSRPSPGV